MIQLDNGWYMPDNEVKMTRHIQEDTDMSNPNYERKIRQRIIDTIPLKQTFVDVGANVVVWSMDMKKHFQKIVSYEPSTRVHECLIKNLGDAANVEVRDSALGDKEVVVQFHDGIKNCGDSKIAMWESPDFYTVQVKRLDDENLKNISLIKIDVQGYELPAILGMEKVIEEQNPWVCFEINNDVDTAVNFFLERNYDQVYMKSKRVMIMAPKTGFMAPAKNHMGRYLGDGPYEKFSGKSGKVIPLQQGR